MRTRSILIAALLTIPLCATTLERLSLDEMIGKSTSIVRGKVAGESAVQRGGMIYTSYRIEVAGTLKGKAVSGLEVSVPGGALRGIRQSFAGTPHLDAGHEYVIFVWTSSKGINHIIGLSQGLFDVVLNSKGETILRRGPAEARMVDGSGREVPSGPLQLTFGELEQRVRAAGGTAK